MVPTGRYSFVSASYVILSSVFNFLVIIWEDTENGPKVIRIFLPSEVISVEEMVKTKFPDAEVRICPLIKDLVEKITLFLRGEEVKFDIDLLDMERCSYFQRRVLTAEYGIPRGWISTYGRIARYLGIPKGARAVGNALSNNPFPIIIPCHRAIRSNGEIGGYQGGLEMKRRLLEMEGIEFSESGKVVTDRIYY